MAQDLLDKPIEKHPELAVFRKQDAAIANMHKQFGELTVKSPDDKEGFQIVHDARMTVKKTRIAIEATRKELKADALAYGRTVDGEAKRLTGSLKPLEEHLQGQEDIVVKEKERLAEIKRQENIAKVRERLKAFQAVGVAKLEIEVDEMNDQRFELELSMAKRDFEAKQKAEAEERERLKAERAELDRQRAEQRKIADDQRAAQDKIDAEQKRIDDAKRAEEKRLADIEAEKQKAVEIEQAKKDAVERAEREAAEKAEREEADRIAEEAAKPYRGRLKALAVKVSQLENPDGKHAAAVAQVLQDCVDGILAIAKKR